MTRYVGKICQKHPEQGGLRYKVDSRCVECGRLRRRDRYHSAKEAARRQTAEWKAATNARTRKWAKERYRSNPAYRAKEQAKARSKMKARRADPEARAVMQAKKLDWRRGKRLSSAEYKDREARYMAARHKRRWANDPAYRKKMRKWTALYIRNRAQAQPPWQGDAEIDLIYEAASAVGLTVDHIVPLRHPSVCGLHVPWNLQPLTAKANSAKGNRFDG